MTTKIINFQSENVKRIEAVEFTVTENGLTIIGGNNSSGKTSILDSIMWALGGDKYKPSMIKNNPDKESMIKIELTNGLVVERKGIDCSLKITDSRGMSGGQKLLNQLIGQMALNLPKFNDADSKGKAKILLGVLGIEDQLSTIEAQEKHLTTERHDIGVIEKQKRGALKNVQYDHHAIEPKGTINEMVADKDRINKELEVYNAALKDIEDMTQRIAKCNNDIKESQELITGYQQAMTQAAGASEPKEGQSEIIQIEEAIDKYESQKQAWDNTLRYKELEKECDDMSDKYLESEKQLNTVRQEKLNLMNDAKLPLEGLSIDEGELIYQGQKWDNMSSSDQLIVSAAIVKRVNPECGFVLVDKLEQMDVPTLDKFGAWAVDEGLQIIGTRVSTGEECSIIIDEGKVK